MALKIITIHEKTFDIAYDIINPNATKDLVILHGWGSNKEIMKQAFSHTLKEFRHIYIDLPGFGKSGNEYVLTTHEYAHIIKVFLESIHASSFAIMGHSYGGKVATLLNPKYLILLSSAGIIEQKPASVKFKIALSKFFKNIGLGNLTKVFRSKDVNTLSQNMYETFKNVVNEDFTKEFRNFSNEALIFWGKEDAATSLSSGQTIDNLIETSYFKAYDGDHYFFLKNSHDIGNEIVRRIL